MIKQQLVLQEGVKLSKPPAIVHTTSSLLSQRCSARKDTSLFNTFSSVSCLFYVPSLYLHFFCFSLSFSQHVRGQNLTIHFHPHISFSHLMFMPTRTCSTPFSSPTWWCRRWLIWGAHCRWPQPCNVARGKPRVRCGQRSRGTRPTAGTGTPLGIKRNKQQKNKKVTRRVGGLHMI